MPIPPSDELLSEALDYFWDHGYRNSNINALVSRTHLNRHNLYSRFGGKQQLAFAAAQHYRERMRDEFSRLPLRSPLDARRLAEAWQRPSSGSCLERLRRRGCFARRLSTEHESESHELQQLAGTEAATLLREQYGRLAPSTPAPIRDAICAVLLAELEPGLVDDLASTLNAIVSGVLERGMNGE